MKSPLRYPGGKLRHLKWILPLFPKNLPILASPFFGGGAVELACSLQGIKVYGYDSFDPLVNFWQETINDSSKVAEIALAHYPLSKSDFYKLQKAHDSIIDSTKRAGVFYVLNRASFSGLTLSGGMSPGHECFNKKAIEYLSNIKLTNLSVDCMDFRDSISRHSTDFLYLDPPYPNKHSTLYGYRGDKHKHFNHFDLANILKGRDYWILSYRDCDMVRDLYSGYRTLVFTPFYSMSRSNPSNELLILSEDLTLDSSLEFLYNIERI